MTDCELPAPPDVRENPRYQQEHLDPWQGGAPSPMPIWNLDGISWTDAPAPARHHKHVAQTVGWVGIDWFQRCPCGASWSRQDGWYQMHEPRTASQQLPAWLDRLDEPAITGLYLAYVDLWHWLRRTFRP